MLADSLKEISQGMQLLISVEAGILWFGSHIGFGETLVPACVQLKMK